MADGPETRAAKPESMLFNAERAAEGSTERSGLTGCTFTTELRRHFNEIRFTFTGKHVTFSAKDPSFSES